MIQGISNILKQRFSRNGGLMRSIKTGQAGNAFLELSGEMKELEGSRMVWWKNGMLKIQARSSVQKQELILKKNKLMEEMRKKGIEVEKVEIIT